MKIISWNVNGIRAAQRKGLLNFMLRERADFYCFQEIKAKREDVDDALRKVSGYEAYWHGAEKKGYAGVLIYSKVRPLSVIYGIGDEEIDKEGRVLTLEFLDFYLINAYFPHSGRDLLRLKFKLDFNRLFLEFCKRLKKPIIIASDFNVAHKEIDLRNPQQNKGNAGFTINERNWFGSFLGQGHIDTFRSFVLEEGHYTWWSYCNNARQRNIGWRIDYFIVSEELRGRLVNSYILKEVWGSDHCPIGLVIKD